VVQLPQLDRRSLLLGATGSATLVRRAHAQLLDPTLLAATLAAAAQHPRLRTLIAARHGQPLVERVFRGPGLDRPANIKSASKSVLSALVGIAIARGVLEGPEQRVAPLLGPLLPREADPRVHAITVGHLLSMRAGLERTSGGNYGAFVASRDWVRHILTRPFDDAPGGAMIYSTGSSHLLAAVLARATRRSVHALAQDWLGRPLGIAIPDWRRDPQGIHFGGNDMLLSPRALLRFGELYRNLGRHGGREVVPESWVRESWKPRGRSAWSGMPYGYGWWVAESDGLPVCFAWGYGGQMLYVVPELALTVAMTSDPDAPRVNGQIGELHALLTEGFIPAARRAPRLG
jgi:CubicO group peptidase (beta-lactamase class C family)